MQLAIASTTSVANVDALIGRHLGNAGRSRFAAIACGDYVGEKKPSPAIYHLALAMLGRGADECVAFEDSLNGVRAAKRAGLYTVATPSPWTIGGSFAQADLVLPHLGDADHPLPESAATLVGARDLDLDSLHALHARATRPALAGSAGA